jgi:hypothetical protein
MSRVVRADYDPCDDNYVYTLDCGHIYRSRNTANVEYWHGQQVIVSVKNLIECKQCVEDGSSKDEAPWL